ncbi:MAG: hypothetical protein J07HB67_01883 [halophilic archaeon J07HB67]|nr:MAG: hypothetical protein J07HB67_01883 [halophilic archaeon J07HB67]
MVETLWHPYHRKLATATEQFALADGTDRVAAQTVLVSTRTTTTPGSRSTPTGS